MPKEPGFLFIGRWQPFHKGHRTLIDKVLGEGENVIIAIRDTERSESNPYTAEERYQQILAEYQDEWNEGRVTIISIPDIKGIGFGRDVGYQIREIRLDEETEAISGTKIRAQAFGSRRESTSQNPGLDNY